MTVFIVALAWVLLATSYVWPFVPLIVYPMRRWRGLWAALYCGAIGLLCAVEFRDLHYLVGDFFKASVITSIVRVVVEVSGIGELARTRWKERAFR
ncbi:hypothetical protein [Streptomyces sp. NPDC001635]|nr:hypothetical protein E4K10_29900 [Streptomyces sp. T1317-0309]